MSAYRRDELRDAQGQANFLKGLDGRSDKSTKALAKRFEKSGGSTDFASTLCELFEKVKPELEKLINEETAKPEPSEPPVSSYITLETTLDTLKALLEICQALQSNPGSNPAVEDILQMVGFLGIPIQVKKNVYPDPWGISVTKVFLGKILNQCDFLRMLKMEFGNGDHESMNGVLRLEFTELEKWISKHLNPLIQMQTSITMRQVIAPVPYDSLALLASTGLRLLIQATTNTQMCLSQLEAQTFGQIIDQVHRPINTYGQSMGEPVVTALTQPDPLAWFTGTQEITYGLKPWIILLCSDSCNQIRNDSKQLLRIFESLVFILVHCEMRNQFNPKDPQALAKKEEIIKRVLKIDYQQFSIDCPIGKPFEQAMGFFAPYLDVNEASETIIKKFPFVPELTKTIEAMFMPFNKLRFAPFDAIFGVNSQQIIANALLQALLCESEDWVDKTANPRALTAKCGFVGEYPGSIFADSGFGSSSGSSSESSSESSSGSSVEVVQVQAQAPSEPFIKSTSDSMYKAWYDSKLEEKAKEEEAQFIQIYIKKLVTADINEFIGLLKTPSPDGKKRPFANRGPSITELENLLTDMSDLEEPFAPLLIEKLAIFMTGKNCVKSDGLNSMTVIPDPEIVFANGTSKHTKDKNYNQFREVFTK